MSVSRGEGGRQPKQNGYSCRLHPSPTDTSFPPDLTDLLPHGGEVVDNPSMDEVTLRESLVKLRERDGLTVRKIRADPLLVAFLGVTSPTEAVQIIGQAVSELEADIQRVALEAAYAIGADGDSTLSQRYTNLSKRTNRGYETIRKDSNGAVAQLAKLLLEKQAKKAELTQRAQRGRVLPGITIDNTYTSFTSSYGPRIVAKVDSSSYSHENRLYISLKVEADEEIMWLIQTDIVDKQLVVRLFQRRHTKSNPHTEYMHQASFVGKPGSVVVNFEMPGPYYVQNSDSRGGWQSTMEKVTKTSNTTIQAASGESIRYFKNPGDAIDWDRFYSR